MAPGPETATGPTDPLPGARTALILLLAINMFNFIDRQVLAAVLPDVELSLWGGRGGHDTELGYLTTAFMVAYMIFAPVFGWLADRTSRWTLVGIGVLVWSLASGASGLAATYAIMFFTRCWVGIGEAAYGPSAPTLLSDLYPVKVRGKIMAWFYVAVPVGSALGYVFGEQVTKMAGDWRWAFYLVVPPGLLLGLLCFFMKEPPRGQADATAHDPAAPAAGGTAAPAKARGNALREYLLLLRTPSYALASAGYTLQTFALGGIGAWIAKYVEVQRGVPKDSNPTSTFGAILVVSGLAATILGGLAGDWLRNRHVKGAYFWVSGVSMLLGFPFFLAVLYVPFPLAWVFMFLTCFCLFFSTGPINTILANVVHPSMRATGFALNIFLIHVLGDVISPPIIGTLNDWNGGDMNPAFLLVSFTILIGAVFWVWGVRHLDEDTRLAPTRTVV
jgi:MFS family permease